MSLKRFAMLTAISYHNQQNYNNNNNKNTNYSNNNINNTQTATTTTFVTTTTPELTTTTQIINSNKSTLIQLKQQQQQQQNQSQIKANTFLGNNTNTTTTTARSPLLTHETQKDKFIIIQKNVHDHKANDASGDDVSTDIITDSSSSYSSESNEFLDSGHQTPPDRQPSHTYTSTTYYGSGFGVFHQQNVRSNGGGIALITGNSASNGLGGGSYSNGINNNVNLLLGGAMLTLITTILCVVCYCCHRNIKKRTEAAYRQQRQWLENDPNMEIYSVEQCYETSGLFVGDSMDGLATIPALHHEPPPSYDAVVAMQEQQQQLLIQQHQQQLIMQQQLIQQQLITNNSPPPGYRSSLDVSSIMQARGSSMGGSIISGMEINFLASSTANITTATQEHSPIEYNDVNGNVATVGTTVTTVATPTNNRATVSYLRNKQQQQQQQRNLPSNQLSQLNMKKVLQAQSCCSLQRAEVENMWNAAAAALAARSAHLPNDVRTPATTSTSSPTLVMNTRKLSQGFNNSKTNTPETFGSRYLKQNYYRRGCPLCGKFRYDNDSTLSISMESNIDILAGSGLAEEQATSNQESEQNNLNNNNDNSHNNLVDKQQEGEDYDDDDEPELNDEENVDDENDNDDLQQQCSCLNAKQKNEIKFKQQQNHYQKVDINSTTAQQGDYDETETQQLPNTSDAGLKISEENPADANANCAAATERQSTNQKASNNNQNNNENSTLEYSSQMPSTSSVSATTISTTPRTLNIAGSPVSAASTSPSVTINLDCINENGIISLDYDAALKLESSGYV